MKSVLTVFSLLLILLISGFAFDTHADGILFPRVMHTQPVQFKGESFEGFIAINSAHQLWVSYTAPKANMPTLVILNGLTYSTAQWDAFVAPLKARGLGLLRYDMYGMGRTFLEYGPPSDIINYQQQTMELKQLLLTMKLRGPYNIVGLSYGGGIAIDYATRFPKDIANVILMSPFTEAVAAQDQMIRKSIENARKMNLYPFMTDDQLYDLFLRTSVYATYEAAEPIVSTFPYRPFHLEGVLQMVRGIRNFRVSDTVAQLPPNVHLMVAAKDQYIQRSVLNKFWDLVPARSKASRILVNESEHKLPEAFPSFTSAWVYQIVVKKNPLLFQGRDFVGNPTAGEVVYQGGKFKITGIRE